MQSILNPVADSQGSPRIRVDDLRKNSGSFATFAAIRRASSRVSSLADDRRPGS